MPSRRDIAIRVKRALHDLGSLGAAAGIVLAVLAFAVISIGSGVPTRLMEQQAARQVESRSTVEAPDKRAQLYLDAEGLSGPPIVYEARVQLQRWQSPGQRVVEALVDRAEPLQSTRIVVDAHAPSMSVAKQLSQRLKGQRVLAAVTPDAAQRLKPPGKATVRLVVTPRGETATLLIDGVVGPGEDADVLMASGSGSVGTAGVTQAAAPIRDAAGVSTAASTRPVIDSLSRYFGRPGSLVTLEGRNFGRASSTRWVTCGGVKATWKSWSSTSITFVVPSKMTKPAYVGVVTSAGTSNGLYYIPFDPPVVSSISPREGAPGSVVTITGTGFGASQGTGWVTFAGRSAEVVSWADNKISVIVPRDAGAGYAGVVAHGLASNGMLYGPYGMPSIAAVSNRGIHVGMEVTLTGRDFGPSRGRILCGGSWVAPNSWTPTRVTFTVPAEAKTGYIGLQRPDGVTSNGMWEFVVPRLDSLSTWWAAPGSTVTLAGEGFGTSQGANQVLIAGRPATVISWSDTSIVIRVPDDGTSGYVGVGTTSATSRGKYLLVETRAHVDSVSPRHVRPGDQITVTGSDFGPQLATSSLHLAGSYQCLIVEWSDTRIVAIVPPGAINGYVGVTKRGVTSNGVWVQVLP